MKTLYPYGLSKLLLKWVLICSSIALLCLFWSIEGKNITWCQSFESEETPAQEAYVSEVVLEAPWAEKCLYKWAGGEESPPGEFGYYASEETELGPNSFTVAPNGDIYISDPLNKRVQRFGSNGVFISVVPIYAGLMCLDRDNNIYTTRASRPHWFIDKYDQQGTLLASYKFEIENRYLYGIHCDNSGRLFTEFMYSSTVPDRVRQVFTDTTWHGICQVTEGERSLTLLEQTGLTRKDIYIGCNSVLLEKKLWMSPDRGLERGHGNLYLINESGDTNTVLRGLGGIPFGCDEDLNIYTREVPTDFYAHEYDPRKHAPLVRKYNPNGEMVSTFRYWCGKPYLGIYAGYGCFYLDKKGDLYVFCQSHEDGIKVIRWSKAN